MILVDTSIWIGHLRSGNSRLADLLDRSQVLAHPFVIGELACGNLRKREEILRLLTDLPQSPVASPAEALHFIEGNQLMGLGIGYIDIHLFAATALAENALLWTDDKRLKQSCQQDETGVWRITPGLSEIRRPTGQHRGTKPLSHSKNAIVAE